MKNKKRIICYKCVRADGTDHHTGTKNYVAAMEAGVPVEELDADPDKNLVCGRGLHVSPTAKKTIQFADRNHRPWRYLEGFVLGTDIIAQDDQKMRVRRFSPTKEIFLADIFGPDFGERIERAKADAATWKDIPWLKPTSGATDEAIVACVVQWRAAIDPWLNGRKLPGAKVEIVTTAAAAAAAAAAADAAIAAADAAIAAAAAADDDAAAADADAADADAAAAAAAADAAAAAADAAAAVKLRYWLWWYVRPYNVLRRSAQWTLAALDGPNPWEPLVTLYRLGCLPIGYRGGKFVVYCPRKK